MIPIFRTAGSRDSKEGKGIADRLSGASGFTSILYQTCCLGDKVTTGKETG